MSIYKKLSLLSLTLLVALSFTSCIVHHNYNRKWYKQRTRVTHYHGNPTGGRHFSVRGRY